MKSAVETLNPTRVKLTVEVTYDELKPSVDAAYKTIAGQVNVPGFRKGKVPPRIIDQRVGRGTVLEEAVSEALPHFYALAVEESDVHPLGRPTVDVTDVPDAASGGDLKFTAEVDVRPQITLPALDSIAVTVDDAQVSAADVDERLANLRERFGTLVTIDRAVQDGDFVSIDIAASIDGNEIDSVKGVSYQVGTGAMLDGMDAVLPGMSAGDTTTFLSPLAGGERAGEDAEVTLTVQAVKVRNLPEADDDFAQLASEFDTVEELRDDLRGKAEANKRHQQGLQAHERLLARLLEVTEIPVPDGVIADEVERHLEAEDRTADEEHRAQVEIEARDGFRTQLLLDALAEAEKVTVGQDEFIEHLVRTARQYGMQPDEIATMVEKSGQVPSLVSEVARRKALAAVLARATVTDASGNRVDFETVLLRAAGSPEAVVAQAVAAAEAAQSPIAAASPPVPSAADPTALPTFDLPAAD